MHTLISRPYADQIDFQPMLELVRLCRAQEDCDPWPPIAELRHVLRAGASMPSADTQIWPRRTGEIAAAAICWDGDVLLSYIHPQEPREEFLAEIVEWGKNHARESARRHGEHAMLLVPIGTGDDHAMALLERNQLVAQEWSILRMARSLADPAPIAQIPPGFVVRPPASAQELADTTALYQEIFMARSSIIQDRLALGRASRDVRTIELVAVGPSGAAAAFCLGLADTQAGAHYNHREGWIDWLGTHPAYRRRGLGRAILRAGLQQLRSFGVDLALLGTGSWNVEAQRLFASEGFQLLHRVFWFAWEEE